MTAVNFRDGPVTILPPNVATALQSAPFTTNPYDIVQFSKFGLQLIITNQTALSVIVVVEITLDGVHWDQVPGSSVTFTANGSYFWDNLISSAIKVRLNFTTFNAGNANFQVYAMAKL